jgi:[methyl-Co(III) methanol-specific corrinoid protein]:coenzyme M methyltransferase
LTPKERFLGALCRKKIDRKPVVSVTQTGTVDLMRMSGSYWPEANRDPEKMARLAAYAYEGAGFEGVRVPFGIQSEAEALGCRANYFEGRNDRTPLIEPLYDLKSLRADADPASSKSTRTVIEAVSVLKKMVPPEIPLIVGVQGPSSLATKIYGMERFLKSLAQAPEDVCMTYDVASNFIIKFVKELEDSGADVITFVDSSASGELIGPELYRRYAFPRITEVIKACRMPTVLHMCGNCTTILPFIIETGANGVSIDQRVSILRAKELVNGKASLIGNINPVDLWLKEPQYIKNITRQVIEEGIDVVAPGCGLVPHTPLFHIQTMIETVKKYSLERS